MFEKSNFTNNILITNSKNNSCKSLKTTYEDKKKINFAKKYVRCKMKLNNYKIDNK